MLFFDVFLLNHTSALHHCLVSPNVNHACRIKGVSETPWLPHLLHLKLQDNLITHIAPLPNLPSLQTLDLSFNHITQLSVIQTLPSFQHLRSLRVNDNPVQHEPHFYFSLQRLMPWTQHEFGHATHFPDDRRIRQIQQEAVLNSPEALQAVMQGQWGVRSALHHQVALSTLPVPGVTPARGERGSAPAVVRPGLGWLADGGPESSAASTGSGVTHQGLVMLEGAARRLRHGQVRIPAIHQHML